MTEHRVISKRDPTYPFEARWVCVCGEPLQTTYMGPALIREFEAHKEQETK